MLWRSKLPLLIALLLSPSLAFAAQTVTFATNGTGAGQPWSGSASASVSITINAGETACVIFGVGSTVRSVVSVADDSGGSNTYSSVITRENAGAVEIWGYCSDTTASATAITVTLNTSTTDRGFLVAWTLNNSNGVGNSNGGTIDANTTHDSGSVTITGSASTLIGCTLGSNGTYTIDSDFTQRNNTTSSTITIVCGDDAITASGAMTNTSGANEDSATIAIEMPEVSAGAETFGFRLRLRQ
jgi:hypothetical protein